MYDSFWSCLIIMMMGPLKTNIPIEYHLTFLVHRQFSVLLQKYFRGDMVFSSRRWLSTIYTLKIIPCLFSSVGLQLRGFWSTSYWFFSVSLVQHSLKSRNQWFTVVWHSHCICASFQRILLKLVCKKFHCLFWNSLLNRTQKNIWKDIFSLSNRFSS